MLGTVKKSLSSPQLHGLEKFAGRVNKFGVNFAVCNVDGELVLLCDGGKFKSDKKQLIEIALRTLNQNGHPSCTEADSNVYQFGECNQILAVVLNLHNEAVGVALIDSGDRSGKQDARCDPCQQQAEVSSLRKQGRDTMLGEMLVLLAENFQATAEAEEQIEMVSTELSQTYEELVLLHKLSTNMKVSKPDANFLQMACDSLTGIVSVEGIAILLKKTTEGQKQLVLVAGSGLIDINERMTANLYTRLAEEANSGKEALLDSEVDSPFKYDWPDNVKNIIAVPLWGKGETSSAFSKGTQSSNCIIGLMVAINRIDKSDFDTTDVKLFNSVANGCAVFVENGKLFRDLKELFIGSLKALTNSIDAKDRYTRGHSERVAFISRWIAERFTDEEPLKEEQIHQIYLAGLLHDIGKVGIDDAMLRKKGKLTERELSRIRTHPSIGAGILGEIKQMRDIVPGVLFHHERVDGKGYPKGLVGERTPLIAKIVGLADSFDAMTSERAYRSAMTVEQALAEIEKGLGTQFDEKVGRTFINSDVYQLWNVIQNGFSEIYGSGKFVEYGTIAVGTLIR